MSTLHPSSRIRSAVARTGRRLALLASVAVLSACSSVTERLPSVTSLVTPYRIDIVQGNVVTREQAQALRTGMSREQVRGILGSPLVASVFHADRWDYVFTFSRQGQPRQQRRVAVFFKGDVLERFEADELPSELEFVASLDVKRGSGKTPVLEATEEQLKKFEEANKPRNPAPAPVADPEPTTTSFPPLDAGAAR
nr:outer membrane protein assembly factor BamE [uncultured Hydrogenophaga sp.]